MIYTNFVALSSVPTTSQGSSYSYSSQSADPIHTGINCVWICYQPSESSSTSSSKSGGSKSGGAGSKSDSSRSSSSSKSGTGFHSKRNLILGQNSKARSLESSYSYSVSGGHSDGVSMKYAHAHGHGSSMNYAHTHDGLMSSDHMHGDKNHCYYTCEPDPCAIDVHVLSSSSHSHSHSHSHSGSKSGGSGSSSHRHSHSGLKSGGLDSISTSTDVHGLSDNLSSPFSSSDINISQVAKEAGISSSAPFIIERISSSVIICLNIVVMLLAR